MDEEADVASSLAGSHTGLGLSWCSQGLMSPTLLQAASSPRSRLLFLFQLINCHSETQLNVGTTMAASGRQASSKLSLGEWHVEDLLGHMVG